MAGHGAAWQGRAWRGKARQGEVRRGMARLGKGRLGLARQGMAALGPKASRAHEATKTFLVELPEAVHARLVEDAREAKRSTRAHAAFLLIESLRGGATQG
jgi:hypothetical protein